MDERRQRLVEQQDDVHLALLMDEYADSMGARVRSEAEKAFETGELSIPEDVDAACAAILAKTTKPICSRRPIKRLTKYLLTAAAAAVLLLGVLFVAHAAGALNTSRTGYWNDEFFSFNSNMITPQEKEPPMYPELVSALEAYDIPASFAPLLLPEGYEMKEVCTDETRHFKFVGARAEKDGHDIMICIWEYIDTDLGEGGLWPKTDAPVQTLTSNGRLFYLFENDPGWTGVWCDGHYQIALYCFETLEDLSFTISGIGVE